MSTWDELRGGSFDSRDIIERLADLTDRDDLDENEQDELNILQAIAENGETCADWEYGVTFIPDEDFEDYARELAEEIGAIGRDTSWPLTYIDWPAAADALRQDYTAFTFDEIDYWGRP